jgi:hypothetical protein
VPARRASCDSDSPARRALKGGAELDPQRPVAALAFDHQHSGGCIAGAAGDYGDEHAGGNDRRQADRRARMDPLRRTLAGALPADWSADVSSPPHDVIRRTRSV